MEIIGYISSILIGISLGLIGSGGSILTVPVLVYMFGVDAVIATSYSLFIVGLVTGLVGAGGGFLIIPALVLLSKLPMKEAVGTSLVIIAAKSLIGFFGEGGDAMINWSLLAMVSAFATVGIFIGIYLSKKIDGAKLKPIFGWFVLIMGIYIIIKETLLKK